MGIFMVFVLGAYIVGAALVGLVVLKVVPVFSVTALNIVVFTAGAIAGTDILSFLTNFVEKKYALYPPIHQEGELAIIIATIGGLGGGTSLVWLKEVWQNRQAK